VVSDSISNPSGPSGIRPQRVKPPGEKPAEIKPRKGASTPPREGDSAHLSPDAVEVSRYQEMVRLHREAYGEASREAKLAAVRDKIQRGHYDDPEAMDRLAERLVEGALGDAGRAEDLKTVRRRTAEGYYDRPPVIDKTSEKMLRDAWPRAEAEPGEDSEA